MLCYILNILTVNYDHCLFNNKLIVESKDICIFQQSYSMQIGQLYQTLISFKFYDSQSNTNIPLIIYTYNFRAFHTISNYYLISDMHKLRTSYYKISKTHKQFQFYFPHSQMSKQKAPQPPKRSQPKQNQTNKAQTKRETDVQKYLKQLSSKTQSFQKIQKPAQAGQKSILKSIRKGKLQIKDVPVDLTSILAKQVIDEEELKAEELRRKRQEILKAIQRLDIRSHKSSESFKTIGKQYSNPDLLKYNANSVLSKQQHQALVQKIKKAQQIQDQRNQQRLYRLQKSLQQQTQKLQKLQQQKLSSQKQLRRRNSQYKLSLRKQINELQNAQQQRSKKQLSQLKKKNQLHDVLEQKYNNTVLIPSLEEKKKKLKEIRELNKSFKMKEIIQHEKKYINQRNKSMHLLNSKAKLSQEGTYKPPEKTQKLSKMLQQELSDHKKELEKHQKAVQEKILRQENYIRILKEKHAPKIDVEKQKEIEHRIQSIHTRKRETEVDARQIGINYLSEAKKMKKNLSQSGFKQANEAVVQQSTPQLQSSRANYLVRNESNNYYAQKRKEQLQKIIHSQMGKSQRTQQLQMQNRKIEDAYRRKEQLLKVKGGSMQTRKDAAELLLSGIKAKMGLIKLAQ